VYPSPLCTGPPLLGAPPGGHHVAYGYSAHCHRVRCLRLASACCCLSVESSRDSSASLGPEWPTPVDDPTGDSPASLGPEWPAASSVNWEDLLALRSDDPALAGLVWSSSGRTVFHYDAGYSIDFNEAGRVVQLTLYAGHDSERFAQYAGELPYGLVWGDTFNSVAKKLPPANWVGLGLRLIWSKGSLGPYQIELSFYDTVSHDDPSDTLLSAIFISP
jgi:hypothetical protein